jgi:hypothetical protein
VHGNSIAWFNRHNISSASALRAMRVAFKCAKVAHLDLPIYSLLKRHNISSTSALRAVRVAFKFAKVANLDEAMRALGDLEQESD